MASIDNPDLAPLRSKARYWYRARDRPRRGHVRLPLQKEIRKVTHAADLQLAAAPGPTARAASRMRTAAGALVATWNWRGSASRACSRHLRRFAGRDQRHADALAPRSAAQAKGVRVPAEVDSPWHCDVGLYHDIPFRHVLLEYRQSGPVSARVVGLSGSASAVGERTALPLLCALQAIARTGA